MQPETKKESFLDLVKFALIVLAIVVPVRLYIAQPFIVSGASMYPTFNNGQYLIVDELSYSLRAPERGEVVIFKFPQDRKKYFIKRIIGLPGETVSIKDQNIFITKNDGETVKYSEPYIEHNTPLYQTTKLGANQYFVMGDNRDVSYDSRYWGPLDRSDIRGRAWLRLFPFTKISYLPGDFTAQ